RDVIGAFLPRASTIYPVPNPVDTGREPPIDVGVNSRMLYVGRMAQEKGVMTLARAAQAAALSVTYVGDGICRQGVERIDTHATCTGWVSGEEVQRQMRLARVLIFPSEWYETQGLVVLEAAAMGLPAIVSDACAAREIVSDGVTGLWFKAGDERDLAAKMALLQDQEFAKRLGAAAFERYWQHPLTMERHLAALEQCYERILSS
ncbi:MAG: glycosyltransferase, partial [Terracidiphilus sp.]